MSTALRLTRAAIAAIAGLGLTLMSLSARADGGMARLMAGDLPVTLVYPSDAPETVLVQGPFELKVAVDGALAPSSQRRRLIVLSHGTGGSATSDHELAATLARAGFMVAQPLHAGDNFRDASKAGPASWQTRPQEVSRAIDFLATHPTWGPLLQTDRVGVHGMSAGGVTALSLAGAQWRLLDLVRHCLAHGEEDAGFCYTGTQNVQEREERRATFERVRGVSEAYLPALLTAAHGGLTPATAGAEVRPDPRVAAVTVAVPLAAIFSSDSLARVRVPLGVVRAGRDQWLLPAFHSDHVLQDCKTCTLLADLPGAGHMDLLGPWPDAAARNPALQQQRGALPEADFDARERSAAWDRVAAFFVQQLRMD